MGFSLLFSFVEKFERKNGNLFLGLNLQEPSKNLLNLLAKKLARYYIGPLLRDIDQILDSGIHQFPFLSISKGRSIPYEPLSKYLWDENQSQFDHFQPWSKTSTGLRQPPPEQVGFFSYFSMMTVMTIRRMVAIRRMMTIRRILTIRRMMTMTTLVTLKHRRLQYSDEREDYHNHMDTSRLIEEEAQYNAWTSISPFSSLFRSTLSITVIIFVWQLYHSLWISDIPCGWSLMMINVLAVLTKSVCTNRRLNKKTI